MERLKKALPRLQEWIAEKLRRRGGESARPGDWEEEERTSAVSVFRLDLPDPGPGDLARLKALLKASVSLEEG